MLDTNLNSVFIQPKQQQIHDVIRKIINISSVVGVAGNTGQANYAPKAGIISFKSIAKGGSEKCAGKCYCTGRGAGGCPE